MGLRLKAAGKYRDYQIQVKVIQQVVRELLGETRIDATGEQAYQNYARMVLSALQKYQEPELSERLRRTEGYIELHGLDEGVGRRIETLVIRVFAERANSQSREENQKSELRIKNPDFLIHNSSFFLSET